MSTSLSTNKGTLLKGKCIVLHYTHILLKGIALRKAIMCIILTSMPIA